MKVSLVNTSCRDCIFARYDGNSQTDCKLGRLKKFVEAGACVEPKFDIDPQWMSEHQAAISKWETGVAVAKLNGTEAPPQPNHEPRELPGGKEYFHIAGRICLTCRNKNSTWAETYPPERWEAQVKDEIRLKMHVVVPVRSQPLEDVIKTVDSLEKQNLPAVKVHIVLTKAHIKRHELIRELRKLGPALVFNVVVPSFSIGPGSGVISDGDAVDMAVNNLTQEQCSFYSVFYPGVVVPSDFISSVDKAINEDLSQFLLLTPSDKNFQGMTVCHRMHLKVMGNRPAEHEMENGEFIKCYGIDDKISLLAKDTGYTHMIQRVQDICPSIE